jgi:MerR family copper efflux transcriptional regulator
MTVSDVAKRTGISPDTVRYYEELGLLPPSPRSHSNYRLFGEETLERIRFIKSAQSLGLRLSDIGELLKIQDDGGCPCGHTKTLLDQRLEQVNREIQVLLALREDLERLRSSECMTNPGACWPCDPCLPLASTGHVALSSASVQPARAARVDLTKKGGDPIG